MARQDADGAIGVSAKRDGEHFTSEANGNDG